MLYTIIMRAKRRCFTLLELIIVLLIAATALTAMGINVRKLLYEQRFHSEVSSIVSMLRLAQEMMLLLNTDVTVTFSSQQNSIAYAIKLEGAPSKEWKQLIQRQRPLLGYINSLQWSNGDNGEKSDISKGISLRFLSGGAVMSKGVLLAGEEKQQRAICLPGYPAPLHSTTAFTAQTECAVDAEQTAQLNRRLTSVIQNEMALSDKDQAPPIAT